MLTWRKTRRTSEEIDKKRGRRGKREAAEEKEIAGEENEKAGGKEERREAEGREEREEIKKRHKRETKQ